MGSSEQLSALSQDFLTRRPKSVRSEIGQFLTPKVLRDRLVSQVDLSAGMKVLDPGVGTGEFLKSCLEIEPNLLVEGWDIDHHALDVARQLVPDAVLKQQSALDQELVPIFDVVIGNPPYFEMRNLEERHKAKFRDVVGGRPNIFSLFFSVGLGMLKEGGLLGYVVPPSMNNGAYFSKLRSFIKQNSAIEFFEVYNDNNLFQDAQTAVQLIVLRKGSSSSKFTVDLGAFSGNTKSRVVFSADTEALEREFVGRTTLWQLGYEAVTGSLVWNQNKDLLRKAKTDDNIPLLWAHNITEEREIKLDDSNQKKPQYIEINDSLKGPAIIVNRITGSVGNGNLRCAIVPTDFRFVGENHVNVIRVRNNIKPLIQWDELLTLLRMPGINKRIQLLTGNTQISATELTYFVPLDIAFETQPESIYQQSAQEPLF